MSTNHHTGFGIYPAYVVSNSPTFTTVTIPGLTGMSSVKVPDPSSSFSKPAVGEKTFVAVSPDLTVIQWISSPGGGLDGGHDDDEEHVLIGDPYNPPSDLEVGQLLWDGIDENVCGVPEAPQDGNQYGREDGEWTVVEGYELEGDVFDEAPQDGKQYGREDGEWTEVVGDPFPEAPMDGEQYARQNGGWSAVEGVSDGPHVLTGDPKAPPSELEDGQLLYDGIPSPTDPDTGVDAEEWTGGTLMGVIVTEMKELRNRVVELEAHVQELKGA